MKSTTIKHQIIPLILLFLFLSPEVGAQPQFSGGSPASNDQHSFGPFLAIITAGLVISLFLAVLFTIYILHITGRASSNVVPTVRSPSLSVVSRGLNRSVIETFPTFSYSEVKDHQIGKEVLECAVCLSEFEDEETLRLIPKCDHVFHPECIDAWLESHVTCPVCRADLVPQPGDDHDDDQLVQDIPVDKNEEDVINDQVVIQIDDENKNKIFSRNLSLQYSKCPQKSRRFGLGKFRSFSTGHDSLVQPGEDMKRFTLILPDMVRKEVIERALLNRSTTYTSIATRKIEKSEREVKSGRW